MMQLLREVRGNPVLWLLAFVPAVLIVEAINPEAHTPLFVLSVLAIVPLAIGWMAAWRFALLDETEFQAHAGQAR